MIRGSFARVVALAALLAVSVSASACGSSVDHATRVRGISVTKGSEPVPTRTPDSQPGWERRQGDAALALVRYPWQQLGYSITFKPAVEGYIALNYPDQRHIDVFVRREQPLLDLAHVIAHELGHAYDQNYNDDRIRNEWKAARGFPNQPGWLDQHAGKDFALPGGDYAEVFGYWAVGGRGLFKSELAPPPPPGQLDELAKRFFRTR